MDLFRIADVFAVFGFSLMIWYFCNKKKRNLTENLLLTFGIIGFFFDIYSGYTYLDKTELLKVNGKFNRNTK